MEYKKVYICSPYRGKTGTIKEVMHNVTRAREYCATLTKKYINMIPVAPHAYFTQFMDDADPEQRAAGLAMGRAILATCDYMMVFGDYVSEGMRAELMEAKRLGIIVYNGDAAIMGDGFVRVKNEFWEREVGTPAPASYDPGFHVNFPCHIGDTLWAVHENDDAEGVEVEQTPPVKAVAVLAGGKFAADIHGDGVLIGINGPDLFLTEEEALAEQARRRALLAE